MPPTGEARAQVLVDYAAAEGLELGESVAYADSTSDLPMLEAVGFPVAVNPETRLAAHRPQARLAGRAVVEVAGSAAAAAPDRPPHVTVAETRRRSPAAARPLARARR